MVALSITILSVCLHAAFCLPILPEIPEQWDLGPMGIEDVYSGRYVSGMSDRGNGGFGSRVDIPLSNLLRQRFEAAATSRAHTQHAQLHAPEGYILLTKREEEEGKEYPSMGLGVLSNMQKFFNELRTNVDSVEEVAALSKELGAKSGAINPEDFLALLAKHRAKSAQVLGAGGSSPRAKSNMGSALYGYNHDDQPYVHSGLGK
ncbi:hypothetical protein SK128_020949 [Halocaridina rubra]|uniref:Uncharacterized protein n=1 Tax=Halocaridina rubra TaxID=373956 RepID=A0AAN9FUR4_HALRR